MGAVAMASISQFLASWVAFSIYSKAALPAALETWPVLILPGSAFSRSRTLIVPGLKTASSIFLIELISMPSIFEIFKPWRRPRLSPMTTQLATACTAEAESALAQISGPIPAGSPMVTPMTGLSIITDPPLPHPLDPLADAGFRSDQRGADIALALLAEGDPG